METSARTMTETLTCKQPGCTRDAVAKMGKFAGLCAVHIEDRRRADANGRSASPAVPGLADKVKRLGKVGRDVDRLRGEAKKLTEKALTAKRRADDAEREFHALARELMGGDVEHR
jgi:hypothetical protein